MGDFLTWPHPNSLCFSTDKSLCVRHVFSLGTVAELPSPLTSQERFDKCFNTSNLLNPIVIRSLLHFLQYSVLSKEPSH